MRVWERIHFLSKSFTGTNELKSYVLTPFGTVGSLLLVWPLQKAVSSAFATAQRIRHWSFPMGGFSLVISGGKKKKKFVHASFSELSGGWGILTKCNILLIK